MIVRIILIIFILLAGCKQKVEQDKLSSENLRKSSNVTKSNNKAIHKNSSPISQRYSTSPKIIQAKSKIYQSLQNMGITANNLDFLFHPDASLRKLMQEKLVNTRDPYHSHLVWQRLKDMLEKDKWKQGFSNAITALWNNSDESLRTHIINSLIARPKLSKIGRTPWMAGEWLFGLKVNRKYDLQLLETLKTNQHHSRQWVRNYLSRRYNKNFGSNYIIWKRYLEQN